MGVGTLTTTEARLIQGLFVPRERWGWEFVDTGPSAPSPLADRQPVWQEPESPDLTALTARRNHAVRALLTRLVLPMAFVVFGMLLAGEGGFFFVPAGLALAVVACLPPLILHYRLGRTRSRAASARADGYTRHLQALTSWQTEVDAHDRAELRRREATAVFYPVSAPAATPRIDVFGGTGDGWASLLATAGCSVLTGGTGILLVDLSERAVGGGLARLAGQARWPVESWDLPRQLDEVALLDGLGPREAGELVADAFGMSQESGDDPHRRALHADLVTTVAVVLYERLSIRRLAEGLRVLEGLDDGSAATSLSTAEAGELTAHMDAFGRGDRIADELRYLRSSLEALSPPPPATAATAPAATAPAATVEAHMLAAAADMSTARMPTARMPTARVDSAPRPLTAWWPVPGLRVLATSSRDSSAHRKELTDRLLVQTVLHQLRCRQRGGPTGRDMLVVAGADHLGRAVLTGLTRHAELAGVRLVLLFERLADDAERVLGSQGGSTIIMRLGNGKDAATAAEFIGRGYRFVMSQVTAQVGRSFTAGDSDSVGYQDGTSETTGTSGGTGRTYDGTRLLPWLQNTSKNAGWQESVTASRSQTWQRTTNSSVSDSTTDGTTSQRVYEFTVEPTTVQTLPATAFLLVNPVDGAGRVVPGDCNPGTVLLPGVSAADRWSVPDAAATPLAGHHVGTAGAEVIQAGTDQAGPARTGAEEQRRIEPAPPVGFPGIGQQPPADEEVYRLVPPKARPSGPGSPGGPGGQSTHPGARGWVPGVGDHHPGHG